MSSSEQLLKIRQIKNEEYSILHEIFKSCIGNKETTLSLDEFGNIAERLLIEIESLYNIALFALIELESLKPTKRLADEILKSLSDTMKSAEERQKKDKELLERITRGRERLRV